MKIGRNDPCPCGSGKKFKKCCIDKPEYKWQPPEPTPSRELDWDTGREIEKLFARADQIGAAGKRGARTSKGRRKASVGLKTSTPRWTFGKLDAMSTAEIVQQLDEFGISVEESDLAEQLEFMDTLDEIRTRYVDEERLPSGMDTDFLWLAFFTLAQRLRPDKPLLEHISFWMDDGYSLQDVDVAKACDKWWQVWTFILGWAKQKNVRSIEVLDEWYVDVMGQYVTHWMADFDEALHNLGLHEPEYMTKRLEFVRSAQVQFVESEASHLFDWSRAEAECLFRLNDAKAGDTAYARLVDRFPDEGFAYIGWGDEHSPMFAAAPESIDAERALEIYQMGLEHGTVDDDEIRDRIALLQEHAPDVDKPFS